MRNGRCYLERGSTFFVTINFCFNLTASAPFLTHELTLLASRMEVDHDLFEIVIVQVGINFRSGDRFMP